MKTPLINRVQVKQMALDVARQTRSRPFSRVSSQFLEDCQVHLAAYVRSRVHSAPSVGKTLLINDPLFWGFGIAVFFAYFGYCVGFRAGRQYRVFVESVEAVERRRAA